MQIIDHETCGEPRLVTLEIWDEWLAEWQSDCGDADEIRALLARAEADPEAGGDGEDARDTLASIFPALEFVA